VNWQTIKPERLPRLVAMKSPHHLSVCDPVEEAVDNPEHMADAPEPYFTFNPSQEVSLQKRVAFVHQSVAPAMLLTDLSKQSGTPLQLSPDVAPNAKVSAFSSGMTLQSAMAALARLYGARWSKDGDEFVLHSNHLDELHTLMSHMGDSAFYPLVLRSRQEYLESGNELAEQIVGFCDEDELKSKEGVAFSSLPNDLKKSVLTLIHEKNVGELVVSQQRVDDGLSVGLQIRFVPLSAKAPRLFGAFYTSGSMLNGSTSALMGAYTADGRFITNLFPEFVAAKASAIDEMMEKSQAEAKEQAEQNP